MRKALLAAVILQSTLAIAQNRVVRNTVEDFGQWDHILGPFIIHENNLITLGVINDTNVIRAYNKDSSELVWTDPAAPGLYAAQYPGRLVVAGDGGVRAYSTDNGGILWTVGIVGTQAIAANENVVAISLIQGNGIWRVFGLDPGDGRILWQDVVQNAGEYLQASTIAVIGFETHMVGSASVIATGTSRMLMRSVDARSGNLRWEYQQPGISPLSIVISPGRLYVGGIAENSSYLAAFETGSGDRLWQDVSMDGQYYNVSVRQNQLVVTGFNFRKRTVRSFNADAGNLLWQDDVSSVTFETLGAAMITDSAVYVFGLSSYINPERPSSTENYRDLLVRVYDRNRGFVQYEDKFNRTHWSPARDYGGVILAGGVFNGGELITVGTVLSSPENRDWFFRTYEFGDIEGRPGAAKSAEPPTNGPPHRKRLKR